MKEARVSEPRLTPAPLRGLVTILPNRWQGETDCVVGPFSGRKVAEYFANSVVDFGQYETISRRVFAKGDAWYVEVSACQAAPVLAWPSAS